MSMEVAKERYVGRVPRSSDKLDLRAEFNKIADGHGYLGAADGALAYAYIRVSGEQQAEEGRSGLPRQILHIHELALKGMPEKDIPPLKIPWDMLYADDGFSGFEFKNRPALNAFLKRSARTNKANLSRSNTLTDYRDRPRGTKAICWSRSKKLAVCQFSGRRTAQRLNGR
jgi:hypothetical protein